METVSRRILHCFMFLFSCGLLQQQTFAAKTSYIVYLGGHSPKSSEEAIVNSHHELLGSVMKSEKKAKEAIFYSYTKEINGFAATMEEDEANEISNHPGVLSVFKDRALKLHTTHSWDFIGLPGNVSASPSPPKASSGADVIIGHLDTGVWPESKSFSDDGMGPIPSKWKGICQNQNITDFACNKKLIGARYFDAGFLQANNSVNDTKNGPRDTVGHGTHTLSTSGGSLVTNVSYFGYANGTAKGGAPHARVAMYRVCWRNPVFATCYESDILAAIDAAIYDGVDVLSLSLGGEPVEYFRDSIAIGSFHAVNKGIVVVCAAGNTGPERGTLSHVAPWIFTVAANTIDRYFPSYLVYDGKRINGISTSNGLPSNDLHPIISSITASVDGSDDCFALGLKANGKIVVCNSTTVSPLDQAVNVEMAGGVGMVLINSEKQGELYLPFPYNLPTIHITYSDGLVLQSYLTSSNKSAMGLISCQVTSFGNRAPQMPLFSSQGPSVINKEVLKPDISAPGVQILAAFSGVGTSTGINTDASSPFALMSGTSMSAPHIAAISALLKSQYPTWSPAMIKSAIMTTATIHDNTGQLITMADPTLTRATPFSYGSGQVKVNAAMDPGLVYDLTTQDYLNFLCANGYNSTDLTVFIDNYTCPSTPMQIEDLNLPSISVPYLIDGITVTRKVTNVGPPSKYKASVDFPNNITVTVNPAELDFDKVGEEKVFQVAVAANHTGQHKDYLFGRLKWSDGNHSVEIPLAVKSLL